MFVCVPSEGYHFSSEGIARIASYYKAKYMGYWAIKDTSGNWGVTPVDVFYQPNPDKKAGHSNYFGMYLTINRVPVIMNAESAFSEPIVGVLTDDGEVIVSRFRHDYVTKGKYTVDGGRDYTRVGAEGKLVTVKVLNDKFKVETANE